MRESLRCGAMMVSRGWLVRLITIDSQQSICHAELMKTTRSRCNFGGFCRKIATLSVRYYRKADLSVADAPPYEIRCMCAEHSAYTERLMTPVQEIQLFIRPINL